MRKKRAKSSNPNHNIPTWTRTVRPLQHTYIHKTRREREMRSQFESPRCSLARMRTILHLLGSERFAGVVPREARRDKTILRWFKKFCRANFAVASNFHMPTKHAANVSLRLNDVMFVYDLCDIYFMFPNKMNIIVVFLRVHVFFRTYVFSR